MSAKPDVGTRKFVRWHWGLRIWNMGHWSFKLKFGSMGNSLLFLNVLIKCPEIHRN